MEAGEKQGSAAPGDVYVVVETQLRARIELDAAESAKYRALTAAGADDAARELVDTVTMETDFLSDADILDVQYRAFDPATEEEGGRRL